MNVRPDPVLFAAATGQVPLPGTLPHAPLAMPKQRLEAEALTARGIIAALLRPLAVRLGRNRG